MSERTDHAIVAKAKCFACGYRFMFGVVRCPEHPSASRMTVEEYRAKFPQSRGHLT